jgi:predicted permease
MPDFKRFVRENLPVLTLPRRRELKIVDELAAQLEESYESLVAGGLSEDEAWKELQRQLPSWTTIADELMAAEPLAVRLAQPRGSALSRATGTAVSWLRDFAAGGLTADIVASLRLLAKDRGFTSATVVTLAVCLGANAAIFTVVYSVLLRPLPIPGAERIVTLGDVYPTITPNDILSNDAPSYFDRLTALTTLEQQAMFSSWYDTISIDGVAEEVPGMRATPSLFRLLQVAPAAGRLFTEDEGTIGAERKIILSYGLWLRLYGGDPFAIGRELRLGWTGQRYTVVGVLPRDFSFFERGGDGHARGSGGTVQFWIPLAFSEAQRSDAARTRYGFFHVGRLRPGATVEQVQAQVDALNAATFERFPQFAFAQLGMYTVVTPLRLALTRSVSPILYLLWGGAAFVLLIGLLNIANLAVARANVRARELATRLALGAARLRVARQLIVEGICLAALSGLAAMAVGSWILRAMIANGLAGLPNAAALEMDWPVLGYVAIASVLVGVLIGLVPSATLARLHVSQTLADGSRLGTGGRTSRSFRRGLVVAQVAVAIVLLVGAGLLLASFRNLLAVDAGFDADSVSTATVFPPPARYTDQRALALLSDRLLESIRGIPGVRAAGMTSNIAMSGRTSPATVSAVDNAAPPDAPPLLPSIVSVTPGYFQAMGTPLIRGRDFLDSDRERTLLVAIVDERLAARLWPNQDPLGKRVTRGEAGPFTVVGVVRDVHFESLGGQSESVGAAYFPHTQAPLAGRLRWIAVKTASDPVAIVPALRSAIKAIDPDLPLADIQTMAQRAAASVVPQKLAAGLATMFGVVALFLAALGIYGVLAYIVAQRTREIGIRIALGSTARQVFGLVFREGLWLVGVGLALGLVAAVALGRMLEGHVFGITPTDPVVISAVAVAAGLIGLLASVSPARRATRVDPVNVLGGQ